MPCPAARLASLRARQTSGFRAARFIRASLRIESPSARQDWHMHCKFFLDLIKTTTQRTRNCPERSSLGTMELARYIDIMPDETPSDRRKVQRLRLDLPLRVEVASTEREEAKLHFQVHDISSDGAFIKTKNALPAGTVVTAEIDLPYSRIQRSNSAVVQNDCMITTTGWISHVRNDGMVIRFKGDYRIVEIPGSETKSPVQ
jgi:hypothetical protein